MTKMIKIILTTFFLFSFVAISKAAPLGAAFKDTIAIICLNDFHGGFIYDEKLDIPGAGNIYSVVKKLQKRYPANLTIAVGDNFGGSFFSNQTQGELIPYFFNKLGIRISALGNHEFDNGEDFLASKWGSKIPKGWNITYICGNIENTLTKKLPDYAISDTTCSVKVGGNSVKIGLLGLITSKAASGTKGDVGRLLFKNTYKEILDNLCSKESLKNVDIQVLVAHIGTEMKDKVPQWEENVPTKLPKAIKGIASGHSHKYVKGEINNVPVVQGEINGKRIGVLRFVYDNGEWEKTSPLVLKVGIENDPSPERSEIDSVISKKLNDAIAPGMGMTCGIANVSGKTLLHDRNINSRDITALGSYVCMGYAWAYRKCAHKEDLSNIVLAFSHFGGIRRSLPVGPIDVLGAGEVLPFANQLRVYELTGKEIRNLIEAGIKNTKGQLQMNNIVVDTIRHNNSCRVVNVHYVIPNKQDVILNDAVKYPVVVDEFIATGGDGYAKELFPESSWKKEIQSLYTTPSFLNFLWTLSEDMREDYIYKGKMNNAL